MINTKSIAFKNAIIYLLLFLLGIGIVGLLMFRYSARAILDSAEKDIVHRSELVEVKINEYINGLNNDISYLASSPVLRNFINDPSESNFTLLSQNYLSLIESKTDFSQIRFIGIEDDGKELIRVDRNEKGCMIIEPGSLQSKGDRSYYNNALKLKPSEIYFSEINLNREFGKISVPQTPTLRIAKPIYVQDVLQGVIVINTNLVELFTNLSSLVGDDYSLRMINAQGYYILHDDPDSTFLFDIHKGAKPQINISNKLYKDVGKVVSSEDKLYMASQVQLSDKDWLLQNLVADKDYILSAYYHWRNNSLLIIIATSLLFMAIAFYILNRQAKRLGDITNGMLNFPKSRVIDNLPTDRKDEIGYLARSLNELAAIVNDQMDTVEEAKDNAETAVREKSEFIENMSHEIRNPLQSIIGLTSMLESNNPTPAQLKLIQSLAFNTSNLTSLVNNILDFQNVIKGEITLNFQWSNLSHLLAEVISSNKYTAVSKSIELKHKKSLIIDHEEYKIDRLRMSQLLNNLISNAIKYTDVNGVVELDVEVLKDIVDKKVLRFSVHDNGIGLTDLEIDKMKERYVTGGGVSLLSSSFGLGLTIVNELLSYLDSSLEVQSVKGKGSTFYFDLELEHRQTKLISDNTSEETFSIPAINILVVEDDLQIRELYQHFFENTEARITYSAEVPSTVSTVKYDLVISDYRLENATLLDQLDSLVLLIDAQTPVIVVSATRPDTKTLSSKIHSLYYMRKPFRLVELSALISEVLIYAKFGKPVFESIKSDYDYREEKYTRAIGLMRNEWSSMHGNIIRAMRDMDFESYKAILHKMITSIRRLELTELELYLIDIQTLLEKGKAIERAIIVEAEYALKIYLEAFDQELS